MFCLHAWCLRRPEEDAGSPGTAVGDGCDTATHVDTENATRSSGRANDLNCWATPSDPDGYISTTWHKKITSWKRNLPFELVIHIRSFKWKTVYKNWQIFPSEARLFHIILYHGSKNKTIFKKKPYNYIQMVEGKFQVLSRLPINKKPCTVSHNSAIKIIITTTSHSLYG